MTNTHFSRRGLLAGVAASGLLLSTQIKAHPGMARTVRRRTGKPVPRRLTKTPMPSGIRDWIYFNVDPAYPTPELALKDAERVYSQVWSPLVGKAMAELMNTTPGEAFQIKPGDIFDFMRTGQTGLWGRTRVAWKSPGNHMHITGDARRWILRMNGQVYTAVLPGVCNNLAGIKASDCVYIDHEVTQPYSTRMLWTRHVHPDDDCFYVRQITELGQPDDGKGWVKVELKNLCDGFCNMDGAVRYYHLPIQGQGHIDLVPGLYQFRLARGEKMAFCIETPGASASSSFMVTVDWDAGHYRMLNGAMHAIVHAVPQTMPGSSNYLNNNDLYYWARNSAELEVVGRMAQARLAGR